MKWYILDSESPGFEEIVSDEKYKIHFNGSLSILDTQLENNGSYWVVVSNAAGTASENIEVVVEQRAGLFSNLKLNCY